MRDDFFFLKHLLNTIQISQNVSRSFFARLNVLSFRRRYSKGEKSLQMTHYIMTCDVIGHDFTLSSRIDVYWKHCRLETSLSFENMHWILETKMGY